MRRGLGLALLVVVALGLAAWSSGPEWPVWRELGPVEGWRCLHEARYVYEPRALVLDGGLLAERPEDVVRELGNELSVERVEVDLRSGEGVVWVRAGGREQRVYVLAPGRLRVVLDPAGPALQPLCVTGLGNWQIVGEHALG